MYKIVVIAERVKYELKHSFAAKGELLSIYFQAQVTTLTRVKHCNNK